MTYHLQKVEIQNKYLMEIHLVTLPQHASSLWWKLLKACTIEWWR